MDKHILAGLPLAALFVIYLLIRGRALVIFFKEQDENIARLSDRGLFAILLASFVGAAFLFGAISGVVYGLVGSRGTFMALAFGTAVALSILAVVSKTPLIADKIVWNLAVGGVLGLLVPLLSAG
ncbi:MAG: hypothetical protein AB1894_18095 [Chloroflexota bacterium]